VLWAGCPQSYPQRRWKEMKGDSNQRLKRSI